MTDTNLLEQSHQYHQKGDYEKAVAGYESFLAQEPNNPQACYLLALLYFELELLNEALIWFSRTVELAPDAAPAHYNLGVIHFEQENYEEAARCYEAAANLSPADADIYFNLALTRKKLCQYDAALACYEKVLDLTPDDIDVVYNIGVLHKDLDNWKAGITAFEAALGLEPNHPQALNNLAFLYHLEGCKDKAIATYRKLVEIDHNTEMASHMLAALTGETTDIPPEAYVREVFDNFSAEFEESLVGKLGYTTPERLRQMIETTDQAPFACGLDMGCGTGLSGEALSDLCKQLVGFDLSPNMLEQAAGKNIYTSLHEADICSFLQESAQSYDLFAAADVFVYIGDLTEIFQLVKKRASKGALFAFSTERADDDFSLKPTGRYGHSRNYITTLARENNFKLLQVEQANIRKEKGEWIRGNLYLLKV